MCCTLKILSADWRTMKIADDIEILSIKKIILTLIDLGRLKIFFRKTIKTFICYESIYELINSNYHTLYLKEL